MKKPKIKKANAPILLCNDFFFPFYSFFLPFVFTLMCSSEALAQSSAEGKKETEIVVVPYQKNTSSIFKDSVLVSLQVKLGDGNSDTTYRYIITAGNGLIKITNDGLKLDIKKISWKPINETYDNIFYIEPVNDINELSNSDDFTIPSKQKRDWNRLKKKGKFYLLNLEEKARAIFSTSATRRRDTLFYLPNSISVIDREQILAAGCNNIPEALRLIPGVIVREQTNGNFDVHIRGLDNVPPGGTFTLSTNTTTLVMIDGRPVYSYFSGGTFYESLPIGVEDIQQIDLIKGAASVMYGPNAASGVINIITTKETFVDDVLVAGNVTHGFSPAGSDTSRYLGDYDLPGSSTIANLSVGHSFLLNSKSAEKDGKPVQKLFARLSGNYQKRQRHTDKYYNFGTDNLNKDGGFISQSDLVTRRDTPLNLTEFPDPELALDKTALNSLLEYQYGVQKNTLSLSAGLERSLAQKTYSDNQINPVLQHTSSTEYLDLRWNHTAVIEKDNHVVYNVQASRLQGDQFIGGNVAYDFDNSDVFAEVMKEKYFFRNKKKNNKTYKAYYRLSLGVNYREANYQTTPGSITILSPDEDSLMTGRKLTTLALTPRLEVNLGRLNIIAGLRADKFNAPDNSFISSQAGFSWKMNEDPANEKFWVLRGMYGEGYRAPILTDLFFDQTYDPFGGVFLFEVLGNDDLDLLNLHTVDLGVRFQQVGEKDVFSGEVELFYVNGRNFTDNIIDTTRTLNSGRTTIFPSRFRNIPLRSNQFGTSMHLTYENLKSNWRMYAHATLQMTKLKNYSPYTNVAGSSPDPNSRTVPSGKVAVPQVGRGFLADTENLHWQATEKADSEATPALVMGFGLNKRFFKKEQLELDISGYWLGEQTFTHKNEIYYRPEDGDDPQDNRAVITIPRILLLNCKVAYNFRLDDLPIELYGNLRNIGFQDADDLSFQGLDDSSGMQYPWNDPIRPSLFLGMRFGLR
ncbi:MAG: TonB-dependent receptor plug domain-containing protein [Bacteroidota bacterium]